MLTRPEREAFLLHGATASTGAAAVLVVLNVPSATDGCGADGTFSALGGTSGAQAIIGRTTQLGLMNILEVRLGAIDRSTLGHPGKSGYCVAEDEAGTSWQPLAEQRGVPPGALAVTVMAAGVMAAGAPRRIMNEWTTVAEEILETCAAEIRANRRHYSIWPGNYAIVVAPQHRAHLEAAGRTEDDVVRFIHKRARIYRRQWADVGKSAAMTSMRRYSRIHIQR
ncbi:MAG: hypothetical protein GKR94_26230 [Gammaproteobacteria bacterium]|nr:hypothetical protein [Gammaproteobacteria bacterium]